MSTFKPKHIYHESFGSDCDQNYGRTSYWGTGNGRSLKLSIKLDRTYPSQSRISMELHDPIYISNYWSPLHYMHHGSVEIYRGPDNHGREVCVDVIEKQLLDIAKDLLSLESKNKIKEG